MHRNRRSFGAAALALAWPATALHAQADALQVVVPYTPGGVADTVARMVAEGLGKRLNRGVVVHNKPGANAMLGSDFVAKSKPDGNTLLLVVAAHAINPSLYKKMPYDPLKDLTGVSLIAQIPLLIVSTAQLPPKTIQEFVAYGKANPGKLFLASSGNGSGAHLAGEMFAMAAGIEMQHVPYKGMAPALTDLFSGQVSVAFDTFQTMMPHVQSGKLRALAVTGDKRSSAHPEVPTVAETVLPGFVTGSWIGFVTTAGTPKETLERYGREIGAVVQSEPIHGKLVEFGLVPVGSTPAQFDRLIADEAKRWGDLVRAKKISLD